MLVVNPEAVTIVSSLLLPVLIAAHPADTLIGIQGHFGRRLRVRFSESMAFMVMQ